MHTELIPGQGFDNGGDVAVSSGCNVRSVENILGQSRVMQEVVISGMASEFDLFASNLDSPRPPLLFYLLSVLCFTNNSKHGSCLASLACLAPPVCSFQTVVDCTGPIRSNPNLHRSNHPDSNRMQIEKSNEIWEG